MHTRTYNCKLKGLADIYTLARTLSDYFPDPEQCITGIYELLLNAVEHGNLGVGYERKTQLIREGNWYEEIMRRLALPENRDKEVEVSLTSDASGCRLTIADQGDGFAWREYMHRAADAARPNGRGLWIVFNSHFDHVQFNAAGNEVTCVAAYCASETAKETTPGETLESRVA